MIYPTPADTWIDEPEVLARLGGISSATLRRWIERNVFPAGVAPLRGSKRRWRASTVDRWITEQEKRPGDAA